MPVKIQDFYVGKLPLLLDTLVGEVDSREYIRRVSR